MRRFQYVVAAGATTIAMLAFAGNSILCRMALMDGSIDPASFTAIRLASGAATLALVCMLSRRDMALARNGSWLAAAMLFLYAVAFSFAYVRLGAATGALILFGFVQGTMISVALYRGERPGAIEVLGWCFAVAGLTALLLPGVTATSPIAAVLMAVAGIAWGIYSILGKKEADALASTSANFLRSVIFLLPLIAMAANRSGITPVGLWLAVCSGALTSGIGYVIWYVALARLSSLRAALVQLSVPAIAALGGILLLAEPLTSRFLLSGAAVLGGVLIALLGRAKAAA